MENFRYVYVRGLNSLIQETTTTERKISDQAAKQELTSMRDRLSEMRVALVELENLEEKYKRGDTPADTYFDRRKKLVRDFYLARDEIGDGVVPDLADRASSADEKGRIARFKELLKSNKDFTATSAELLLTIAKIF